MVACDVGVVDSDDSIVDGSEDEVNDDDNVQSSSLGKRSKTWST